MIFSRTSTDPPLVAEGGLQAPHGPIEEPYLVFDDLMAVVEALSPTWPERDQFISAGKMLL